MSSASGTLVAPTIWGRSPQLLKDAGEVIVWLWKTIAICRVPLFALAVVTLMLGFTDQGRDVLVDLSARPSSGMPFWTRQALFLAATVLWAVITWYALRVRLYFARTNDTGWRRKVIDEMPRLMGIGALLVVAFALGRTPRTAQMTAHWSNVPVIVAFSIYVHYRRRLPDLATSLKRLFPMLARILPDGARTETPSVDVGTAVAVAGAGAGLRRLVPPHATTPERFTWLRRVLIALTTIGLVTLMVFTWWPVPFGHLFGTGAIVVFSVALWVALGTAIAYASDQYRFPFGFAALVLVVGISRCNDNHDVRKLATPHQALGTIGDHFDSWFQDLVRQSPGEGPVSVFFVYTEGGGIRSAYWTAAVLGELEDENPGFARHVFAVSGVSGGSLGAAIFAASIADKSRLRSDGCEREKFRPMVCTARAVLGKDFLSPTVGALLFPDLVQRFVPFDIFPDRAGALEKSWERAWTDRVGTDRLGESFDTLWAGEGRLTVPSLFLNSTWAEKGSRVVISNLETDAGFADTHLLDDFLPAAIPLSTAAHLSARFPGISPPGNVLNRLHLIDGGYFDNSGAETLGEVMQAVNTRVAKVAVEQGRDRYYPVVIEIHNHVEREGHQSQSAPWLPDVSLALTTFYDTQSGQQAFAEAALRYRVLQGRGTMETPTACKGVAMIPFNLKRSSYVVPLGWMLSESSMAEMNQQIVGDSVESRHLVKALLTGNSVAPANCPN